MGDDWGNDFFKSLDAEKEKAERSPVERLAMPPALAEVLKTFPLREPDRVVEGPNGEILAEWHDDGNYFEIEYMPETIILEIMTQFDGETRHWVLK
jgi:hypothetical protein